MATNPTSYHKPSKPRNQKLNTYFADILTIDPSGALTGALGYDLSPLKGRAPLFLSALSGALLADNATDLASSIRDRANAEISQILTLITIYSNISQALNPVAVRQLARTDLIRNNIAKIFNTASLPISAKKSRDCRRNFMVLYGLKNDRTSLIPYACNCKACPMCSRIRSQTRARRVMNLLDSTSFSPTRLNKIKHLVLTIKSPSFGNLEGTLTSLLRAFRQFRQPSKSSRRPTPWQSHVHGYLFSVEITANLHLRTWHPHIHLILDSHYWPQSDLDKMWKSFCSHRDLLGHAHIESGYVKKNGRKTPITDRSDLIAAVLECTKYTLKPFETRHLPATDFVELLDSLRNRRLVGSGGSLALPRQTLPATWVMVGGLGKMIADSGSDFHCDDVTRKSLFASIWQDDVVTLEAARSYPYVALALAAETRDKPTLPNEATDS